MHIYKNYLFFTISLIIGATALFYILYQPNFVTEKKPTTFNIAILSINASYHTPVARGFIQEAQKESAEIFKTRVYITETHNKTLTTAIAEEILNSNFDLLVTIGAMQSAVAHTVNKKRHRKLPHLCIGAGDMIEAGLITSNEKPGGNVTGVSGAALNPLLPFKILLFLKPYTKKILIPYCPHSSHGAVEKNALLIQKEAIKENIDITLFPFDNVYEAIQHIRHIIKQFDTILCLEGDLIDEVHPGVGKLCSEHNVTFFSGALNTIKESAAAGFGVDPILSGQEAFEYARRILVNRENPGDLPIKFVDNARRIAINKTLCAEQDMSVPPLLELCLSRGVVYP